MTLAYLALKPSRWSMARIIFQSVRTLQVISCAILWNDSERREQVSTILSSVTKRRVYFIHLKKSRFVDDVLFYPKNEIMAFPNIEIKWDWVSDVHVYIKSNAVIRFWQHCRLRTCHLRIKLSTVNVWYKQTHGQNGVVSTAGGVNFIVWPWYFSALSFHAPYSIRSHFRKWFVSQIMEPLGSLLNLSRLTYCSVYDEHTCNTIFFS